MTRVQEILSCLDDEMAALRAAVDAVPEHRRGERPSPERWSVAEVLEHVAMVENTVLKACSRQLAAVRDSLPPETETTSIRATLPPERVANRDRTLVAPDVLHPKGLDAAAAWDDVEQARARLKEFVQSCEGLAVGQIAFPHPVFGRLDMYQWLLFAAGHHARHAAQIRELAAQLR